MNILHMYTLTYGIYCHIGCAALAASTKFAMLSLLLDIPIQQETSLPFNIVVYRGNITMKLNSMYYIDLILIQVSKITLFCI